ncbi:heavy-metal-associated domain-containing protein [Deminuibacter soli]|uniref:Copper chaperone n=1 Tax=Deminuibacter soli TaxID=2291815 RepID=A0A3E1NHU5_9BACT|nr:heavy-metal-associated domain-containing protein [Deminuibacter soli]RFM27487.1 copper chaperone [Deminuibacter soli]
MQFIKIFLLAACTLFSVSIFAQGVKTETFKVQGNCGSCKKHIETAAKGPGVTKAEWNKDTKVFTLVYDPAKTNSDAVQKKIAAVGYDTEKYKGDDKAYAALDECCQYERKASH